VSNNDDDDDDGVSHSVYMLMCTSVGFEPTMKVNLHNQCLYFYLIRGRYFSIGADWDEKPAEKVYTGNMMSVDLIPFLSTFGGVLTYDLEKRGNDSIYIRLFVAWKSEGYKKFRVFVHLVEYEKWHGWGKNELEEYFQRYASQFCIYTGPIRNTWLMPDDTVLMTESELDFTQRDGVLNITISEGTKGEHAKRPEWVDLKR
jgi:hypothetical protein